MCQPKELDSSSSSVNHTTLISSWWRSEYFLNTVRTIHLSIETTTTSTYQFGDAQIETSTDDQRLFEPLRLFYGECKASNLHTETNSPIKCVVSGSIHPRLVWVAFTARTPTHLTSIVLGLLHPPPGDPSYAIQKAEFPGWQVLGGPNQPPVAAVCDHGLIYDKSLVPADFLSEFIVAATLAEQSGILALHAASLKVGKAGILLTGASKAGKTTTSMHLATYGHALLGDEVSAIRLSSQELLPFRKSLSIRAGPRSQELTRVLDRMAPMRDISEPGKIGPHRIERLFPDSHAIPVRLETIFFLEGIADQASVEPFRLTLAHVDIFRYMAANDVVSISWGVSPTKRALRLLALNQIISNVSCWKLTVGPPEETAQLIKQCVNKS